MGWIPYAIAVAALLIGAAAGAFIGYKYRKTSRKRKSRKQKMQ